MIGLEKDEPAIAQMNTDGIGHIAKVSADADTAAAGFKDKADGVAGVVGKGKALDAEGSEVKAGTGGDGVEVFFAAAGFEGSGGGGSHEDGFAQFFGNGS